MNLQEILSAIASPDEAARRAARRQWDTLAKPLGSLGLLEDCIVRVAALTGSPQVQWAAPVLLVCCGDNGVVAQGVAQSDHTVTAAVARSLARGDSTVCHMARSAGCTVVPVDVGMLDFPGFPGVLDRRVQNGTGDITLGPAMGREVCLQAIEVGFHLAEAFRSSGLILTGEMGIGNTTTAAAVTCALLGLSPEQTAGRGSGLTDAGLRRKIRAIQTALTVNRPDAADPMDVLAKVGGLDMAALCGIFLGGAYFRVPVVIDGLISAAGALCAARLCPDAQKAMLPSHLSSEPSSARILRELGLRPLITAEMRLGEGSGAVAALPLMNMALSVYQSGHTFAQLGIRAYEHL